MELDVILKHWTSNYMTLKWVNNVMEPKIVLTYMILNVKLHHLKNDFRPVMDLLKPKKTYINRMYLESGDQVLSNGTFP